MHWSRVGCNLPTKPPQVVGRGRYLEADLYPEGNIDLDSLTLVLPRADTPDPDGLGMAMVGGTKGLAESTIDGARGCSDEGVEDLGRWN